MVRRSGRVPSTVDEQGEAAGTGPREARVAARPRKAKTGAARARAGAFDFPPAASTGYTVRDTNRAFQRLLERRIAPYGITRGQWYFLRVLWVEDGLTQRELSARVGTMEPTTAVALRGMEKAGLVRRLRNSDDRRKVEVRLTAKARRLRPHLLPIARKITREAAAGIAPADIRTFLRIARRMTRNLDRIDR